LDQRATTASGIVFGKDLALRIVCQSLSVVDEGYVRVVQRVPESEKIIKSWPEKKCDLAKIPPLKPPSFISPPIGKANVYAH
jgi:hypothetical protein